MHRFGRLIEQLADTRTGPDMVNPWRDEDPELDLPGAAALRRAGEPAADAAPASRAIAG